MPVLGPLGFLPLLFIYIYTVILEFHGKFKRFYEYIYLYIYMFPVVFGCPASGHRTPWLSQLKRILWFIFHQKQVF